MDDTQKIQSSEYRQH